MTGNSDEITRAWLDTLTISYRVLDTVEATTDCTLFGKTLKTPILLGGLAHYEKLHPSGVVGYAQAAKAAGSAIWTGYMPDAAFEEVLAVGVPTARIVKPFANRDMLFQAMEHDAAHGAVALASDVDHAYNKQGRSDAFGGQPLKALSKADLKALATDGALPFFAKGILSVRDAEICAEAGIAGIVVSQHQNLFPWSTPPVKLLPAIRKAVGSALTVLCDSCLDDGYAAFKALALGADGVFTVRPMMPVFREIGPEGVTERLEKMTDELRVCLSRTGAENIRAIDPEVIQFV